MDEAKIQQALKTLAFFDVSGLPVAESAVKRWQYGDASLTGQEWRTMLDWHATLAGRATLRDEASLALIKRMRPWLRLLCLWPGVQALFLCNSVAFLNATEQSDVDVFVICKPGQLWVTRFVLTALLQLFGMRPRPGHEAGTICLSFFVAADALDLASIAIADDIYLSYWLATLVPVFDQTHIESRLLSLNKSLLPNHHIERLRIIPEATLAHAALTMGRLLVWPFATIAHLIKAPLKRWQMKRFPATITAAAALGDHRVVIGDTMLKFHTTDRRENYKQAFQKRYDELQQAWRTRHS